MLQTQGSSTKGDRSRVDDALVLTIWVDARDPVNGASFKPRPSKPVPPFMDRPAGDAPCCFGDGGKGPSLAADHTSRHGHEWSRRPRQEPRAAARHSEPSPTRLSDL